MWIKREQYDELLNAAAKNHMLELANKGQLLLMRDLKDEIQRLKDRTDREQQRADSALQTMVAHKTGVAVPMPQVAPSNEDVDPHAEDSIVVDELRDRVKKEGAMAVLLEDHRVTS